jgi:uncharacterized membrane protein YkgB
VGIAVQIIGSLLVLAAFALVQWGVIGSKSMLCLSLNTVGSAALAAEAIVEQQWGFLLLEGVWAIVSAISLIAVLSGRDPHTAH